MMIVFLCGQQHVSLNELKFVVKSVANFIDICDELFLREHCLYTKTNIKVTNGYYSTCLRSLDIRQLNA